MNMTHQDCRFLNEVADEVLRARAKFPDSTAMLAAVGEEYGEVCNAMLNKPWSEVRLECIQLACTALRLAREGDPALRGYRTAKGLDHPC